MTHVALMRVVDYTKFAFTPGFKPNGYNSSSPIPLGLTGVSEDAFGISGPGGTVFAFMSVLNFELDNAI